MAENREALPRLTKRELADEAWWLWHRLYEFELIGPYRREKLNEVEVDRMMLIGRQLQEIRSQEVSGRV